MIATVHKDPCTVVETYPWRIAATSDGSFYVYGDSAGTSGIIVTISDYIISGEISNSLHNSFERFWVYGKCFKKKTEAINYETKIDSQVEVEKRKKEYKSHYNFRMQKRIWFKPRSNC